MIYTTAPHSSSNTTDTMDNNSYNQDQWTTQLFDDLPKIRNQAKEKIIKSQNKQKKYHARKIREKKYSRLEIKYYITTQLKKNSG
jgi:hypothetical protein